MRFSTENINLQEQIPMLSAEAENALYEMDNAPEFISFNFDFPDIEDDSEASKLEPSEGDISIMVAQFLLGFYSGEQEHWWFDKEDKEHSTRLTWSMN